MVADHGEGSAHPRAPLVAALDVGSNSILMLVARRGLDGTLHPMVDTGEICQLARGMTQGRLAEASMQRALATLSRLLGQGRALGVSQWAAVGTKALRTATNAADFLTAARRLGIDIEVISGHEEARLGFLGAASGLKQEAQARSATFDIGGASTELALGQGQRLDQWQSFDVGAVAAHEAYLAGQDPPLPTAAATLSTHLHSLFRPLHTLTVTDIVGIGGTVTTLACIARAIHPFSPSAIDGLCLGAQEINTWSQRLLHMNLETRRALPGMPPERAEVLPAGLLILQHLLTALRLDTCRVSTRGLRHGLLQERFASA